MGGVVGAFCKSRNNILWLLFRIDTFLLLPSRSSPLPPPPSSPSPSLHSPPGPSLPADLKPQPPSGASEPTPTLALEYQPLPRREKTCEDLQVEALTKQLVRRWRQQMFCFLCSLSSPVNE